MEVKPILKYRTLAIAKAMSPVDTGNLKHNAIRLTKVRPNSWTINYNTVSASYIEPLEEGWTDKRNDKTYTTHKGFIEKTSVAIADYVQNQLSGKYSQSQYTKGIIRRALETAQDSPERRFRHRESIMRFYQRN